MGAVAVAVIVAKEREIVEAFRDVGATSPERGVTLDQVGVDERIGFRRLRQHAVIREASPGRYYLDEEVWTAVRATRRRVALVLLAIGALLAAGGVAASGVTWIFAR